MNLLAWLYWNPNRIIFTLPIVNHPVAWYGLWFVFGFLIGYLVLIPMLQQKIGKTKKFSMRDVSDWPALLKLLQQNAGNLFNKLTKKAKHDLANYNKTNVITPQLQEEALSLLTSLMTDPKEPKARSDVEALFPKSLFKVYYLSVMLVDKLAWFVIAGTIIGARLGHVFFYEWPRYQSHPLEIFQIWKGGLASHGGAIGVIIALYFFIRATREKFPELSFIGIMDSVVVPTAFVGCCIRIGNFFNQEILGHPTTMPWAIIFGDSMDGTPPIPRHPVQLYEEVIYLSLFILLYRIWETRCATLKTGFLSGIFFILMFIPRFFLEFFKTPTSLMMDESLLQTGQLLSLPFIALGIALLYNDNIKKYWQFGY